MSQTVGFDWGFVSSRSRSSFNTEGNTAAVNATHSGLVRQTNNCTSNNYRVSKGISKRRFTNDDGSCSGNISGSNMQRRVARRKAVFLNLIQGQPLPIARTIELMDRDTLQTLLLQLLSQHPEIQDTLVAVHSTVYDLNTLGRLLERKLQAVYDHIPYSKHDNILNDYAFVRVKAAMLEFLNCLIDCILESIPPRATNLLYSFKFLTIGTRLLAQLPDFETQSNNYYKNVCYEQLAEIWNTLIKHASADINFLSTKPALMHYLEELKQFNGLTKGKFETPLQLFCSVLDDNSASITSVVLPDDLGSNILYNNFA